MVKIGQKVRFIPRFCKGEKYTPRFKKQPTMVIGSVIFVNPQNEVFVAEYTLNGVKLREGFKFVDIGKVVKAYAPSGKMPSP